MFLKESEETLLEVINHFIKKTEEENDKEGEEIIIALTKTINRYTILKKAKTNFTKIKDIYEFLEKNIKSQNVDIRNLNIEAICNLISLMDTEAILKYKADLSKLMLNLLIEIHLQIGVTEERKISQRDLLDDSAKKLKFICIETTVSIVNKLDQTGNNKNAFLDPLLDHLENNDWKEYRIVAEMFTKIITNFAETESAETVPFSVQQIYIRLLDCLFRISTDENDPIDKRSITIERILKITRKMGKSKAIDIVDLHYKNV